MSPLDLSVLLFFILIGIKVARDSISFWQEQDELATLEYIKSASSGNTSKVSNTNCAPNSVTRTSVRKEAHKERRVKYRVYSVDLSQSVTVPASSAEDLQLTGGAGRQMTTAA